MTAVHFMTTVILYKILYINSIALFIRIFLMSTKKASDWRLFNSIYLTLSWFQGNNASESHQI